MMRWMMAVGLTVTIGGATPTAARQDDADALRERALEQLRAEAGRWTSRWDRLDAEGKVVASSQGIEVMTPTLNESALRVVLRMGDGNVVSEGIKFFHPIDRKILHVSISANGDMWILEQEVGSAVIQSRPHVGADGTVQILRWTIEAEDEDSMDLRMEYSLDEGRTWTLGNRQSMRRTKG